MTDFKSKTVKSTHSIELNYPISEVFPLFTPKGEELWVDGWDPVYMNSKDGRTEAGLIFKTSTYKENTLWYVLDYNQHDFNAKYLRITPDSRIGTVSVNCTEVNEKCTNVEMTYDLISLTEKGNEDLKSFAGESYVEYINSFKPMVEKYFAND